MLLPHTPILSLTEFSCLVYLQVCYVIFYWDTTSSSPLPLSLMDTIPVLWVKVVGLVWPRSVGDALHAKNPDPSKATCLLHESLYSSSHAINLSACLAQAATPTILWYEIHLMCLALVWNPSTRRSTKQGTFVQCFIYYPFSSRTNSFLRVFSLQISSLLSSELFNPLYHSLLHLHSNSLIYPFILVFITLSLTNLTDSLQLLFNAHILWDIHP